ncbi:dnaJ homolog subfamily C member 14 [Struthio camelus]|uniref:dnaJ homolog subfamily C member 14 n=1 Tax=Struthio camelus TaxID=8801 RepID=UPI003603B42B
MEPRTPERPEVGEAEPGGSPGRRRQPAGAPRRRGPCAGAGHPWGLGSPEANGARSVPESFASGSQERRCPNERGLGPLPRAVSGEGPGRAASAAEREPPADGLPGEELGKGRERDRSSPRDSAGGSGWTARATEDSAAWNGSCDREPALTLEDDDLPFLGSDSPGSGPEPSCRCQGERSVPPSPFAEQRDGSCSVTCHHWTAKSPELQSLPRGQEEGEEDGASDELLGPGRALGSRRTRKRQRHRSAPKEEGREPGKREGRSGQGSRRHRPARKRSHAEGPRDGRAEVAWPAELLAQLCLARFKALLEPALTRVRRVCVEAGGRLLCSCCRLSTRDLSSAQASVRTWGQRVSQQARSGSVRAGRWLRAWAELFLRLLWMLCALLFLVVLLLLGSLRLCGRVCVAALVAGASRLGKTRRVAQLLALLDLSVLHRTWSLFKETRTCQYLWDWLQKWRAPPWTPRGLRTDGLGDVAPGPDGGSPGASSREEVARLLAMADVPEEELNPFQVLGLEATASDAELKKAYRRLAVLVHPDKNEHPRAEEAFKVLRAAWDIISNPEKRKEYEIKRMAESELTRSMSEFLTRLQDDLKEAMNTMMCSKCQGKHKRFEMDRDPLSARYCAECNKLHPAEEGDFWAESSMLGLKITYFAMMDGKIYDITEWAGCQRVGISPDTHRVPYHISFGSRSSGPGGRQRATSKGSPTSAADLQDFFNRVFQGTPGPTPGRGFSPPPPAAPSGAAASTGVPPKTDGAASKGDVKHKRRKKVRRPFQR